MGRHLLAHGRAVIAGLRALGQALGYHVTSDQPLPAPTNRQELDVAWFGEQGQKYPLMIFEVESAATNAAAANPVKVFAKPNQQFEKPLFFFHIFLRVGADSTRIDDLRAQFGQHNYRAYHFSTQHIDQLLEDILSQHRRVRSGLDIEAVLEALRLPCWTDVDPAKVARIAERLAFNDVSSLLPTYLRLSRQTPAFWGEVLRILRDRERAGQLLETPDDHGGYLADTWPTPIYLGILQADQPARGHHYLQLLAQWQEHSCEYARAIGADYGLSHDHDEFLIALAPAYWAMVAALFRTNQPAVDYVAAQLDEMVQALENSDPHTFLFTALWALHVSAEATGDHLYERARTLINRHGGASAALQLLPPSSRAEEDYWITECTDVCPVPTRGELLKILVRMEDTKRPAATAELARDVLTGDPFFFDWALRIVSVLH